MAVVLNNQQEEKDKENQGVNQPQPLSTGGGASAASPMGMSSAQPTSRQRQGSGRFTNLQQYIQANPTGSRQLASQIEKTGQTRAGQIRQNIERERSGFQSLAQQKQQQIRAGEETGRQLFRSPQEAEQQQIEQFQQVYRPDQLQQSISGMRPDIETLRQGAGDIRNLQQQAQTESGRFNLLRQTIANPRYTQGQRRLDQLLLQGTPASSQIAQNFGQLAGGLEQNISSLSQTADQQRQALSEELARRSEALRTLFTQGEEEDSLEADIGMRGIEDIMASTQQRFEQAQQDASKLGEIRTALEQNQLTSELADRLGLTGQEQLYNLNLADYMTNAAKRPTLAGVADADEIARYGALQRLIGGTNQFEGQEVGSFTPFEFDAERFQGAVQDVENQISSLGNKAFETFTSAANLPGGTEANPIDVKYSNFASQYGHDHPATKFLKSIVDAKADNQVTGQEMLEILSQYRQPGNFLQDRLGRYGRSKNIEPLISELERKIPKFQIGRRVGVVPENFTDIGRVTE